MASPLASTSPQSGGLHANARRFFYRPHTSHGKSTSSALLDEETKAIISAKGARMSREDPGPQPAPGPDDVFAIPTVASPLMSPLSRHEFKAQYIISPAKLHDHLKEARTPIVGSPIPLPEPGLRSPRLEPSRQRSNTTTTSMTTATTTTDTTGSVRSTFSIRSTDSPAPIRSSDWAAGRWSETPIVHGIMRIGEHRTTRATDPTPREPNELFGIRGRGGRGERGRRRRGRVKLGQRRHDRPTHPATFSKFPGSQRPPIGRYNAREYGHVLIG